MDDKRKHALIAAFLNGNASADQERELKDWLSQTQMHQQEFDEISEVWKSSQLKFKVDNLDQLYEKAQKKIASYNQAESFTVPDYRKEKKKFNPLRIAAVATVLLVLSFAAVYFSTQNNDIPSIAEIIKQNPSGQKSKIQLPDGSLVWLNAKSSLSYKTDFGKVNRNVQLTGEAFFEVKKNKSLPFKVSFKDKVVEVLGTSFNVRAFDDEDQLKVALVEGSLKVNNAVSSKNSFMLVPGDELSANLETGEVTLGKVDNQELLWRDGVIYFKAASYEEVFTTLERWYGVKFTLSHKFKAGWNYTGKFSNETLENVLQSISYTKGFDFKIENKSVDIKPKQ